MRQLIDASDIRFEKPFDEGFTFFWSMPRRSGLPHVGEAVLLADIAVRVIGRKRTAAGWAFEGRPLAA